MEIDLLMKIGGSCISNKKLLHKALIEPSEDNIRAMLQINSEIIEIIASQIGDIYPSMKKMIILTGVGSPGHFIVLKHDLHKGNLNSLEQHLGFLDAQIAVNRLRQTILESFLKHNIPAVQLYASSMYQSDTMRIVEGNTVNMEKFLEVGMVPVISGDIVPDISMGLSVLSGDQILADLAKKFNPKRIVYGSNVDGIFDTDPEINPNARLIPEISLSELDSMITHLSGDDASGQMKGKLTEIRHLLESGIKNIVILNLTRNRILNQVLLEGKGSFTKFY
ncbi:MAG: isopentenyl phosphate kinase [Candidatus Hodarchaeales archaeon]|jgi:isopentenyl phosphate kinase